MALGGELSHPALGLSPGSFSLAGVHLEEVFRAGLEIFQMVAVILGFRLVIVRIGRLCGLAQIIGVSSISNRLLLPVLVVQAITAQVGPVPSTRGPSVILTACAFGSCFGAAVAEAANAAVRATIVNNFINSIPP